MIQKRKIPFDILDSIRGIASLYVVIAHCRGVLWIGGAGYTEKFTRSGWDISDYLMVGSSLLTRLAVEFVIVFFVLSGFSIAHSLSGDNSSPLPFYKRRLVRIYPSYIVALLWAALIFMLTRLLFPQWYDGSLSGFSFERTLEMNNFLEPVVVLKNLFYMPSTGFISPFWSLTYEVIFYLLAPFLLRRVNIYMLLSALVFLVNLAAPKMVQSIGLPVYLHNFFFVYNIYFAIGIGLYKYFDAVNHFLLKFGKKAMFAMILLSLASIYAFNFLSGGEDAAGFILSAILSVLLITYFLRYQVRINWLMKVGQYSYTLYITHFASIYLYLAIYWWLFAPNTPFILNYFVWMPAVGFCMLIGFIQFKLVEDRTKQILNRLRSKKMTPLKPAGENNLSAAPQKRFT